MKKLLRSLARDESGQGTLMAVLVLLILGGFITVPLLNLMGTGLEVGRIHEERTEEFYAADAGVEDGIYKLVNNIELDEAYTYTLTDINGKEVQVTIPSQQDATIAFLRAIGVLPATGQGVYNKNRPHSEWLVIYSPIETAPGLYSEYRVTAYYNNKTGAARNTISTGFWICGYDGNATNITYDPDGEDAVVWVDLDGDGNRTADENITTDGPLIDGFVPPGVFRVAVNTGKSFIWEWVKKEGPSFGKDVRCRTQRFALDEPINVTGGGEFPPNLAWVDTQQEDVSISWFGDLAGINCIISTATDPYTLAQTTVTSYLFRQETGDIVVMTYEISP